MSYEIIEEARIIAKYLQTKWQGESVSKYICRVHGLPEYQRELLTRIIAQILEKEE